MIRKTGNLKMWHFAIVMILAIAIVLWAINQEIRNTDRQLEKLENFKQ